MIDALLTHIEETITRYIINWDNNGQDSAMDLSKTESSGLRKSIVINVEEFIADIETRPAIWNRSYHCNKSFLERTWEELSLKYNLPKTTLKTKWKGLRDNFRVEYKKIPRNEHGDMLIAPEQHESKWIHYYSLLFLVSHMRHRNPLPATAGFPYGMFQPPLPPPPHPQQYFHENDDYEETLVEPDLTTGLITIEDDDDDDDEDEVDRKDSSKDNNIPMNLMQSNEAIDSNDSAIYSAGEMRKRSYAASSSTISSTSTEPKVPTSSVGIAKAENRKRIREDDFEGPETNTTDVASQGDPDDDYYYLLSLLPYMKQLNASQKLRLRTKFQKIIFKELYKEDIDETK